MTKKDYELIAEAIRKARPVEFNSSDNEILDRLAWTMAEDLQAQNERFNSLKFVNATRN